MIAPFRDQVLQIAEQIKSIGRFLTLKVSVLQNGASEEYRNFKKYGATIVVGTSGRICNLIEQGVLKTESLKIIVLDNLFRLIYKEQRKAVREIF